MASAGARAYNGCLGAEPPAGSRGRAPGQGQGRSPPEAEKLFAFVRNVNFRSDRKCKYYIAGNKYYESWS